MLAWLLTSALWGLSFVVVTQAVALAPKPVVLAARAVGGLAVVALAFLVGRTRSLRLGDAGALVAVGALGVGAAAWLEVAYRGTFAPGGGVAAFMLATVPAWAAAISLVRREPGAGRTLLAAAFVLVANAMILANWERPSTFSPFVLFPRAEVALLLAAAAWAVGGIEAERRLADVSPIGRAAVAGLGAAWLLLLLPTAGPVVATRGSMEWPLLASVAFVSGGALLVTWHEAIGRWGARSAAFACGLAPAVMSAYGYIEATAGYQRGPTPLILAPVLAGSAVALAATLTVWPSDDRAPLEASAADGGSSTRGFSRLALGARVVLALAAAGALLGLALPSLSSSVESKLAHLPFQATWQTPGVGTIGGWLAALTVLAAWLGPVRGRRAWIWAALIATCGIAVWAGGFSPWVAWHTWIPAEVRAALGSPYAFLEEHPVSNPGMLVAPWLALAAWALRRRVDTGRGPG